MRKRAGPKSNLLRETGEDVVMADQERKSLVWDIRKSLLSLSSNELFQIASTVSPAPGKDAAELSSGDAEGCFEYIHAFMYSKNLLDAEDRGMGELLALKDVVDEVVQSQSSVILPAGSSVNTKPMSPLITVPPTASAQPANTDVLFSDVTNVTTPVTANAKLITETTNELSCDVSPENVQKMLLDYEDLSRKLGRLMHIPTPQATAQPTLSVPHHSETQMDVSRHRGPEQVVSLKDLSYIHRREFKVQGGQIGDHSSDISFNSVCRQIEEGIKDNLTESEIVRGVLRIIKPGDFKDMLVNKEDMTVAELKGFLQSHLGERNSTELFQELMCAKQNEHETPQQFLYRVIGLKQRILFGSKQPGTDIRYSPDTVQDVFLHTVYQGIGHKYNDIRRELKPLLSDNTVTDETILKHVMRVTSDESERQRRLGSTQRSRQAAAHSLQVEGEQVKQANIKKDMTEHRAKSDEVQKLAEKIDVLTKLVDTLAEKVERSQSYSCLPPKPQATRRGSRYGCPKCVQEGLQDCKHCFSCGEQGHRAVGCLKNPKQQGNVNRLLWGDKQ